MGQSISEHKPKRRIRKEAFVPSGTGTVSLQLYDCV